MRSTAGAGVSAVDRFFQFSLLGLLTSGYLAVLGSGFLDAPTIVFTAAALILRALMTAGLIRLQLPPTVVAAATLAYMGFYFLDYAFIAKAFLPATVHLVFFIAIVKILTAVTNRDYFFVKAIAFLELLAACVLSSSFNFLLFLTLFLLLAVATFASAEIRRSAQRERSARASPGLGWRLTGVTFVASIGILALTAALFFLLPRTARAAFQHLMPHRYHLAGFSNEVSLGEIGEIKKQDTPVMHVKIDQAHDRPPALKWRGAALGQFDGRRWFNATGHAEVLRPDRAGQLRLSDWRRRGRVLSYAVHLNEIDADGTLFFAGAPQFLRIDAPMVLRTGSDGFRLIAGGPAAATYQVYGYLDTPAESELLPADPALGLKPELREIYLQVPKLDARIPALAQSVTALDATPLARARSLERYLRTHFGYTLELPQAEAADPLANFLFRRRKGHCEYFASSMAVMLRTLGIPSRVVTGFQSGVYNPISGWQLIRASDAHSWVEAYLPKIGWTTFDPTPPDPNPPQLSLWSRMNFYLDAAEVFWQDWVINYNLDRQLTLASRMEESGRNVRMGWLEDAGFSMSRWKARAGSFGAAYGGALAVFLIIAAALAWFGPGLIAKWGARARGRRLRRGLAHRSDATLLYERMLKALKRRGVEKPAWQTPTEFASVVIEAELAGVVAELTAAYNQLRFGGKTEVAGRMVELVERLEA
jgi:transglutaminase-like putative cysteine protease